MKKSLVISFVAIIIFIITLSYLWKKGYIGMRLDLTNEEIALFSNADELNKAISNHRFEFVNKKIQGVEITGVLLANTDITNLEIVHSSIHNSKLENVEVSGVEFIEVDFMSTEIKDTIFKNCTFKRSKLKNVKLLNTSFSNCKFEESEFASCSITRCSFNAVLGNKLSFTDTVFTGVSFMESQYYLLEFFDGQSDNLLFEKNKLDKLRIKLIYSKEINILNSTISGSISTKEVEKEIKLSNCNGAISFVDVRVPRISVAQCDVMEAISTTRADVGDLVIDCKKVDTFILDESKINKLTIRDSNIDKFSVESKESLFDNGYFSNIKFGLFDIQQSKVRNLTIENSSFSRYLVLKNSTIENMILKNNNLEPGIKHIEENVQYINSMKFPVKK